MPLFEKEKQPHAIFILLIIIAYLPMLSGIMAIKSDSLLVSYPIYYFFGNQLQQGNIPFWHYNLNGGFPMHAEVGSLFWNIPLWIFPLSSKSLYAYTLEIGLHIAIASIGAFKLAQYLKFSRVVSSFMMFCYVCSGFFVAHLQHSNNIFESAYIPFVLLFFLKTVFSPNLKTAIYLSISLFFLINSGYPGFPISMLYFLLSLFIGIILFPNFQKVYFAKALKYLSIAVLLSAILCLPLFVSYFEISDYYFRANNFKTETIANGGGMTLTSLLSFFWPFAAPVDDQFYGTDVAWNNVYIGTVLSGFFLFTLFKIRHKLKWPLFSAGILLLLFSFQGNIKHYLFGLFPLLSLVRSNGEFRIYFILVAIIIACIGLENWLGKDVRHLKKVFVFFILVQITAIVIVSAKNNEALATILTKIPTISFKNLIEQLNVPFLIAIESIINIFLLAVAIFFIKQRRILFVLLSFDLLVAFFANLPFTGLSTKSTFYIQSNISQSIGELNKPNGKNANLLGNINDDDKYMAAPAQFVSNTIKIDYSGYPAMFKTYSNLMKKGAIHEFDKKDPVFFDKQIPEGNFLQNFIIHNNSISFNIFSKDADSIILFQNYHTNWTCEIDGQKTIIHKTVEGFMKLPVKSGLHKIFFRYWPKNAVIAFFISAVVWLLIIFYLLKSRPLNTSLA